MQSLNWKECVHFRHTVLGSKRLDWPDEFGFDCSADFTISDVLGAISWVWTAPGDALLNAIASENTFRTFFQIETEMFVGHWFSTLLPMALLIIVFSLIGK